MLLVFGLTMFNYNIHYPNLYAFVQEITDKKHYGKINSYIEVQEKLVKRCDDVYLETHAISINGDCGFVEWTMGLKII